MATEEFGPCPPGPPAGSSRSPWAPRGLLALADLALAVFFFPAHYLSLMRKVPKVVGMAILESWSAHHKTGDLGDHLLASGAG